MYHLTTSYGVLLCNGEAQLLLDPDTALSTGVIASRPSDIHAVTALLQPHIIIPSLRSLIISYGDRYASISVRAYTELPVRVQQLLRPYQMQFPEAPSSIPFTEYWNNDRLSHESGSPIGPAAAVTPSLIRTESNKEEKDIPAVHHERVIASHDPINDNENYADAKSSHHITVTSWPASIRRQTTCSACATIIASLPSHIHPVHPTAGAYKGYPIGALGAITHDTAYQPDMHICMINAPHQYDANIRHVIRASNYGSGGYSQALSKMDRYDDALIMLIAAHHVYHHITRGDHRQLCYVHTCLCNRLVGIASLLCRLIITRFGSNCAPIMYVPTISHPHDTHI